MNTVGEMKIEVHRVRGRAWGRVGTARFGFIPKGVGSRRSTMQGSGRHLHGGGRGVGEVWILKWKRLAFPFWPWQ